MKVILLQDVKKVGKKHDIVEVKDGYGNFLLTSGKAVMSSNKANEIVGKQVQKEMALAQANLAKANELKNKIEKITLNFSLRTNNGQAFGSISSKQALDVLDQQYGIKIDKYMLVEGNKTYGLGSSRIAIKLHKEVIAYLTLRVTGE